MTKIFPEKYPIGTLKYQKTAGRYVDDYLLTNLEPLARRIVDDMQFMGLCCSSTFEVRTGKSTFLQQIGEAWCWLMKKIHNVDMEITMNNIVFKSQELINRAMTLPKYSFLVLDENDEMDEHYFSQLSKDLRRFFKKSGQLNLFIMIVTPNFFQLKSNYAISRSNFLIDVKFQDDFQRGYFEFYSFRKKKELYLKGKKFQDYSVVNPDFKGQFKEGYVVDKSEYLRIKRKDLEETEEKPVNPKQIIIDLFRKLHKNLVKTKKITIIELADCFLVSDQTGYNWINDANISDENNV